MADYLDNNQQKNYPVWLMKPTPPDGYTYADYEKWDDDINVELDEGMVYMMAGAIPAHQLIAGELLVQLKIQLSGKTCTPLHETDVRLFYKQDNSDTTIFRPDIIVVCDKSKFFRKKNCEGAPDFVIEIISEYSESRDLGRKRDVYEKAGVKEYWVVSAEKLHVFVLVNSKFQENIIPLHKTLKQPVSCLEGCIIDFQPIADMER